MFGDNDLWIALIFIVSVIGLMIGGAYHMAKETDLFILECTDWNGTKARKTFHGWGEEDIDAISECKRLQFEPVSYTIQKVEK